MNDLNAIPRASERLAGIAHDARAHFRLKLFGAVLRLITRVVSTSASFEAAFETYPFLAHYANELASHGLAGVAGSEAEAFWAQSVSGWESRFAGHLPLRELEHALPLDAEEVALLMTVGLPEEDARFGAMFEMLNGTPGVRRPTVGLLASWWSERIDAPAVARRLRDLGLVAALNPGAPRAEWQLAIPERVWDAMRATLPERPAPWLAHTPAGALPDLGELQLEPAAAARIGGIAAMMKARGSGTVVVRGARGNGRRTVLGAIARHGGRGVLRVSLSSMAEPEAWREIAPLAVLLHAMPVIVAEPAPGETLQVPELTGYRGPIGIAAGRGGGLGGPHANEAIVLDIGMPAREEREAHWAAAFDGARVEPAGQRRVGLRMTRGNIRRAARLAVQQAALAGRDVVQFEDIACAVRNLDRESLDTLAAPVTGTGDWTRLAVAEATLTDLRQLESRCRHRERVAELARGASGAGNAGVRALFRGPSGTGKTLAARLLANALGMDLYRIDLAAVVNKYIGETEKNLERAFAAAEALDVVLLLDEGDALLTRRTDVHTANDRYANLETNYLLQRLESYEGILLVTTNAASERIDAAFTRRMDAVVEFAAPQAQQRWCIWNLHLPEGHGMEAAGLWELADRCALSGGQIRNAALHAALLAIEAGTPVANAQVLAAVRREYRKSGAVCPLPASA